MNTLQTILVAACASGGAACFLFSLAYRFRNELRQLHERWLKMSPISQTMCILALSVAVLYGGTKPPSATNEPPADTMGTGAMGVSPVASLTVPADTGAMGVSPVARWAPDGQDARRPRAFRPMMAVPLQPAHQLANQVTNWTARGAYCDWLHITFPDSFEFPFETNMLKGVTLMAYGELRENLRCSPSAFTLNLPQPVSIEPGVSSVCYGLTPSNSFLFSWSNVCVNRDPTNRVDASIELFTSGASLITTHPTNQPTNKLTNYLPPTPPPGFVGSNQDDAWLAAAFSPTDFAAITNKGYSRWLDEDYVGYNEENGHCRGTVTVHAMPPNGQPCYLVCGPYKVIVIEPGNYDFPVEVLTDIHIQTYPTSVPVSFSYDEGYYHDEDDYGPLNQSNNLNNPNNLNNLNNPNNLNTPLPLGAPPPTSLTTCIIPSLYLSPSVIPLEQALNTSIRIWCNMRHAAWRFASWVNIGFMVTFDSRNIARITDATTTYGAEGIIYDDGHPEVCASISLIPSSYPWPWPCDPDPTNGCATGESNTNNTSNGQTP